MESRKNIARKAALRFGPRLAANANERLRRTFIYSEG
jgi:hypothetical protein